MTKEIHIEEVGNAYKIQLQVREEGYSEDHGKPVVVLDTVEDAVLGKAVRDLFRTRIRWSRKAKAGEAVTA
ncbi:MAG: hypothetical protein M0Z38_04855 [Deltaproteobacteria bacterium]|nr:hypothetical protein [Deltaproteobacteria bacterium]